MGIRLIESLVYPANVNREVLVEVNILIEIDNEELVPGITRLNKLSQRGDAIDTGSPFDSLTDGVCC